MTEPRLDAHDSAVWSRLMIQAFARAKSREHARLVEAAKREADRCLSSARNPAIMWSGGKDSTVLTHLVRVTLGADIDVVSEKDDLDYPGEEAYVTGLAAQWGAQLEIVRPSVSPSEWIAANAATLESGADIHSRRAALSRVCFYDVMERANATRDAVLLGLRAAESKHRLRNRTFNGLTYRKRDGLTVCNPLGDWSGLDVYAYMLAHGVEPLHVYRCVGFAHERDPWRVRKSWWLPGSSSDRGGVTWLRHYYPSLYRRMLEWFPRAQSLA